MANIQLRTGDATTNGHRAQLIVDGTDITDHVLSEGFRVGRTGTGPGDEWYVQVRLVGNLELDLAEADLRVAREDA